MKKQLYFSTTITRENPIKNFLLGAFTISISMPTKLCETFTRSDFGVRHYRFSWAIIYFLFLLPIPVLKSALHDRGTFGWSFLLHNLTWYIFLGAFIYKAYHHWQRKRREEPTVFDFSKFTRSNGKLNNWFILLKYKGRYLDYRFIETIVEPGLIILIGLGLIILQQSVGFLIFSSGIAYSAGRQVQYHLGDEIVFDMIDKAIVLETYKDAFVEGFGPDKTKGFEFRSGKPTSKENRQKVADQLFRNSDDSDATFAV